MNSVLKIAVKGLSDDIDGSWDGIFSIGLFILLDISPYRQENFAKGLRRVILFYKKENISQEPIRRRLFLLL